MVILQTLVGAMLASQFIVLYRVGAFHSAISDLQRRVQNIESFIARGV